MKSLPSCLCLSVYLIAASVGFFTGGIWAALAIGLAALLYFSSALIDRKLHVPSHDLTIFIFAVLGLLALELPLSTYPRISCKMWLQLLSIFLPLSLLAIPRLQQLALPPRFFPVIGVALSLGAFILGFDLYEGGPLLHVFRPGAWLQEYNRGMAHAAILAFPFLGGLWVLGYKKSTLGLFLLLLFPAALTESHTAKLALLAGSIIAALTVFRVKWVGLLLALFSVLIVGWPFYIQKLFFTENEAIRRLPLSFKHRVEIWDYLSYRILERPFFGWGLGTTHKLDYTKPHGLAYQVVDSAAPHAHNFIVQIWAETGLLGIVCILAFMLFALRAAYRLPERLRPFAFGCWTSAVIISLFGFDFWTDALWGAFALSAFAFALLHQSLNGGNDFSRT